MITTWSHRRDSSCSEANHLSGTSQEFPNIQEPVLSSPKLFLVPCMPRCIPYRFAVNPSMRWRASGGISSPCLVIQRPDDLHRPLQQALQLQTYLSSGAFAPWGGKDGALVSCGERSSGGRLGAAV
jgi:hypothetical protein